MSDREFQYCNRIAAYCVRLLVVCFLVFFAVNSSPLTFWKRNALSTTQTKSVKSESPSALPAVSSIGFNESAPITSNVRLSTPEKRFCELGDDPFTATVFDQCHQLLDPIMKLPDSNYRQNWLLFGDSTVWRLFNQTLDCATLYKKFEIQCDHCPYLTSTESIAFQDWTKPNATLGEGPAAFGLRHPTCSDCKGCTYGILVKKETDKETKKVVWQKIQYFPVEFARDVTTQCPAVGVKTTQEAVQYYLERHFPQRGYHWNMTTCLVSVGFHDMAVQGIDMTTYVINVENYVRQIRPFCKTMVWLGLHQVMGKENFTQTKSKVLQWNKGVLEMLMQSYPNDVVYIDTTNRTRNASEHHDNIHMEIGYYNSLAMFLFKNLTKFCS